MSPRFSTRTRRRRKPAEPSARQNPERVDSPRQLPSHQLQGGRRPVGVGGEIERAAFPWPFLPEEWGRVEHFDTVALERVEECPERGVLYRPGVRHAAGRELLGMDHRLDRRGQDEKPHTARLELALEVEQGGQRVGSGCRGPGVALGGAALEHGGLEEARPSDVVDVGAEEEPPVAAQIGLLVAEAEPGGGEQLYRRQ